MQESQIPETNQPPIEPQIPQRNLHPRVWISVLVVIVAAGSYLAYTSINNNAPTSPPASPDSSRGGQPSPYQGEREGRGLEEDDELAGWQTYRNEEYGFEFGYPQGTKLSEGDRLISLASEFNANFGYIKILNQDQFATLTFYEIRQDNQTIYTDCKVELEWKEKTVEIVGTIAENIGLPIGDYELKKTKILQELPECEYKGELVNYIQEGKVGTNGKYPFYIFVPVKNVFLQIYHHGLVDDNVFQKILSTFKFIE